jgi:hypothetical protein
MAMKRKFLTLFIVMLLPIMAYGLSTKQLAVSINLAGKQRMLSQKITKEAFLVKAGIEKTKNLKKLQKSRDLFHKTLNGLMKGDRDLKLKACKNLEVQNQLKIVKKLWKSFDENVQKVLHNKATKDTYKQLQLRNLTLLKEMNSAVSMYVGQSREGSSKRAQAINLSGKERMLTQKMAKDLLLISQNFNVEKNSKDLKKTWQLFEKILLGLQKGDKSLKLEGTKLPKIKKQLKVGEKLWREIKPTFQKSIHSKKLLNQTISKLDTLLVEMNKAVKLFEKSVKREKQALKLSSLVGQFMQKKSVQNHIINLSGKQRMLTQKMSKLALLISLNVNQVENKKSLTKAYKLYEKTLKGFLNGDTSLGLPATKNRKIASFIQKLQKEWSPFSKNIQTIVKSSKRDSKALGYVIKNNEKLLKMSNQLVQSFKKAQTEQTFMEKSRANIVDIAGRQRMLTQKMTKEKLLVLAKVRIDQNRKKLQETINLFDSSLDGLMNGDNTLMITKPSNKKVVKQLQVVNALWRDLKPLYEKKKLQEKELAKVIDENPILLAQMHKAVLLSVDVADY